MSTQHPTENGPAPEKKKTKARRAAKPRESRKAAASARGESRRILRPLAAARKEIDFERLVAAQEETIATPRARSKVREMAARFDHAGLTAWTPTASWSRSAGGPEAAAAVDPTTSRWARRARAPRRRAIDRTRRSVSWIEVLPDEARVSGAAAGQSWQVVRSPKARTRPAGEIRRGRRRSATDPPLPVHGRPGPHAAQAPAGTLPEAPRSRSTTSNERFGGQAHGHREAPGAAYDRRPRRTEATIRGTSRAQARGERVRGVSWTSTRIPRARRSSCRARPRTSCASWRWRSRDLAAPS